MRARVFSAIFLGFLALLAVGVAPGAQAQPRAWHDGVQPLDRLLPGIRRSHPGDFYDAEGPTYGPDGDPHYHLKWMTPDGRVIWYDADARNGRVLRASPGRDNFDDPRDYGPPHAYPDRYPPYAAPYGRGYGGPGFGPGRGYGRPGYARPGFARPYGGWHGGGGGRHGR